MIVPSGVRHVMLTTDAVGGVWSYCKALATGLSSCGIKVTVVVLGPPPSESQRSRLRQPSIDLVDTGLPLDWLATSAHQAEAVALALHEFAREIAPDVVHLHAPALLASERFHSATVVTVHSCVASWWRTVKKTQLPEEWKWHARATRDGIGRADMALAPSKSFARLLEATYPGVRIHAVRNGASQQASMHSGAAIRTLVLTAGRLWDEGKNVGVLDRASEGASVPVLAAGAVEGPNGQRIELRSLKPLGLLSQESLAQLLQETAVFVSPSIYEPFGLAVLEAAAHGAALVLSDIPSHRELWAGAATFVSPQHPERWRSAIEALYADPLRREVMSGAARRRAMEYSAEKMTGRTLLAYGRALDRHRSRTPSAQIGRVGAVS